MPFDFSFNKSSARFRHTGLQGKGYALTAGSVLLPWVHAGCWKGCQCPQSANSWGPCGEINGGAGNALSAAGPLPYKPNLSKAPWPFAFARIKLTTGFCFFLFFPNIPLQTTQWPIPDFQSVPGRNPAPVLLKPCHSASLITVPSLLG